MKIEELLKHDSFGNLSEIKFVLDSIKPNKQKLSDLHDFCRLSRYSLASRFRATISLLEYTEIIDIEKYVNIKIKEIETKQDYSIIAVKLLENMSRDHILHDFISETNIRQNSDGSLYLLNLKSKYSGVRNLLIALNIISLNKECNAFYDVESSQSINFTEEIIPLIEQSRINTNRTYEKLENDLSKKNEYGESAEKFVLIYEKSKLCNHRRFNDISICSKEDTNLGYDIQSFLSTDSILLDKFIEVKSFDSQGGNEKYFYWSKNEIKVSKNKGDNYFLYLVDRSKMEQDNYKPDIFKNPYRLIYENENEWNKIIESYKISLKST